MTNRLETSIPIPLDEAMIRDIARMRQNNESVDRMHHYMLRIGEACEAWTIAHPEPVKPKVGDLWRRRRTKGAAWMKVLYTDKVRTLLESGEGLNDVVVSTAELAEGSFWERRNW